MHRYTCLALCYYSAWDYLLRNLKGLDSNQFQQIGMDSNKSVSSTNHSILVVPLFRGQRHMIAR